MRPLSPTLGYAASCVGLVAVGVAVGWPLVDSAGRAGILAAAGLALSVQVVAFVALRWGWAHRRRFLAVWLGGTLARLLAVAAAAAVVSTTELAIAPTLLALASFLFAMLLLEPVFVTRGARPTGETR